MAAEGVEVRDEKDLWDFLERWLADPEHKSGLDPLQIKGWHTALLYFPYEPAGHTISPATAKAVQEFHQSLSRAYALLAYGEANAGLLHSDDKHALEFRAHVTNGSSGIEIGGAAIEQVLGGMVTKMSGQDITVSIVIFLLLYFGTSVAKAWIRDHYDAKREIGDADERVALSQEETRRSEILARCLTNRSYLSFLRRLMTARRL